MEKDEEEFKFQFIERAVIARELATVAIPKGFRGISYEVFPKIRGIATPVCALVRNDSSIGTINPTL